MWEFLNNVLEKAGVVATLYVLTLLGIAAGARYAWKLYDAERKARESAEKELKEVAERHAKERETAARIESEKRATLRSAWEAERIATAKKHARALAELEERQREDEKAARFKLEALLERVIALGERNHNGVDKLARGLDVLVELVRRS